MIRCLALIFICLLAPRLSAQKVAVLKYKGGGDWYVNPTALPNLVAFCNQAIHTTIDPKTEVVEPDSPEVFQYPFLHMTGHGNVYFSDEDIKNLRTYLRSGGFLHIDDNYGMAPYLYEALKKLFPDQTLEELPKSHPIFKKPYEFAEGLPKIHEHDNKPPKAFGIFVNDRLALLFTHETDLGDGWESPNVHNDPEDVRQKALKMGANIIYYAFENGLP